MTTDSTPPDTGPSELDIAIVRAELHAALRRARGVLERAECLLLLQQHGLSENGRVGTSPLNPKDCGSKPLRAL